MAFTKLHQPCLDPECGSSNGLSYNEDGSSKCFVCNQFFTKEQGNMKDEQTTKAGDTTKHSKRRQPTSGAEQDVGKPLQRLMDSGGRSIAERGLSAATCEAYNIRVDSKSGRTYFGYVGDDGRTVVSAKVRSPDKKFFIEGRDNWKDCGLYGKHLFSKGGRFLTICEGEFDAPSGYQMMGSRYPFVSVKNGAGGALEDCKADYEWINSFENIVLCFDADEVGQKAANQIVKLFGSKCKIVKHAKDYKDASDYLQYGDSKLFNQVWWDAEYPRQGTVVDIHDFIEKAMVKPEMGISFPWPTVTKACFGIRPHTIHVVGAAPKIGKTDHQHQLIHHLVYAENQKVGVFDLENSPVKTAKKLASKEAHKDFTRPDIEYEDTELRSALESLEGKVRFYDRGGSRDWPDIKVALTEMHLLDNINIFFIDPITALISRYTASEANDKLNEICTDAADFVNQYPVTLFFYSHVNPKPKTAKPHEAGGRVLSSEFTGSRAMEKWFHYGHGISRDRTEDCPPEMRNVSEVYMLFDREYGQQYKAFFRFDEPTVTYSEIDKFDMMEEL